MAASSSSPSTPAFSSQVWKYHVFLSFRGEGTRKTFVDHLYTALKQKGIYTYKDDASLPRGESIGPSLMAAIEESQIAVIIFSKNYANSPWCLDELVHIMKCKDMRGQIVMPVFYDVDPSEVRKQKRKYEQAFLKYESEKNSKVESWKKALVDACNISGWQPQDFANGHESKAIKQIVETISTRVQLVTSSKNEDLVGIEARVQLLIAELQMESGGVRMVGIWGVGGGGKTTLASSVYDEIYFNFDGFCFLENIREESSKHGLKKLQEKIISGVLKQKQVEVGRIEEGRRMIMDRLHYRKVLIVLDDVDRLEQLEALAGSHDWFGAGSRIIITTRDEHVLTARKVNVRHNLSLLNADEALRLFCKHAPQDNRPLEDYEKLSKHIVFYVGGLPLALRVLGLFLCDKDMNEWRCTWDRLKEIPHAHILEMLKISFDGLTPMERELFLDIACFFRREDKDEAMRVLDACGFHPVIGVKVLAQRALITISGDGRFDMHDLVQEMGHYIVRGEYPNNPEKHSRVWKREDVLNICAMDATMELDMIEAIRIEENMKYPVQRFPAIVGNMRKLRWIDWEGDLTGPFPDNFPTRELCCLILEGSSQKRLWEGFKFLPKLRMIELYGLHNLIMTPNFDGLPNLERFKLSGSWYLEEIHPSIFRLERLEFLSIEFCVGLNIFPPITRLKNLETLTLSRCPKLFKLSEIHKQNMNHIGLQFFNGSLRKLDLSYCDLGDEAMGSARWELPNLRELNLTANKFSRLDFSRGRLPRLKWLNISDCKRLVELLMLPSSIAVLVADGSTSLESFGDVSNCKWLWNVSHRRGNKLLGDILLLSMLQGHAIENHFISVALDRMNPKGFVGRLFRPKTFALHLPHDWYNDFCGFLICFVTNMKSPHVNIIIEQQVDKEDSPFELWRESNEELEPEYDGTTKLTTFIGYVSFGSLRRIQLLNSSFNIVSFSIEDSFSGLNAAESYVGAVLIRRRSKDQVQAIEVVTDYSEFWNEEHGNTFTVKHYSKSSIKIQWFP